MFLQISHFFETYRTKFNYFTSRFFQPENYPHYGDILAIPFFFILFLYFLNKSYTTYLENVLMMFSLMGLLLDIYFTWVFLSKMGVIPQTK